MMFVASHWGSAYAKLGSDFGIAVVQRPTKLFSVGDVAILVWMNGGGERQMCFCRTKKNKTIAELFVQYARYKWTYPKPGDTGETVRFDNKTVFKVIEHPDELEGLPPTDPAVRRFVVESLPLAGGAASRVSENSPANKSPA